jgi:alpha-tubulin suppressor-like RCC1 family protein
VELALGHEHSCARFSDGTVRCWGGNGSGQLGDGTKNNKLKPVAVTALSGVVELAAGGYHTCARQESGAMRCWGRNTSGQLGLGTVEDQPNPQAVKGLNGEVRQIALGQAHTCAVLANNNLFCWGANANGQLGDNSTTGRPLPVLTGIFISKAALGSYHTCAISMLDEVFCTGANTAGQLGNGTFTPSLAPVSVEVLKGKENVELALGEEHSCSRSANGEVRCWGANSKGQLGDGSAADQSTPKALYDNINAAALVAGGNTSGALTSESTIMTWGDNGGGQCGANSAKFSQLDIPYLPNLPSAAALALGRSHGCAILPDARVQCWGLGTSGQLGRGTIASGYDPEDVTF